MLRFSAILVMAGVQGVARVQLRGGARVQSPAPRVARAGGRGRLACGAKLTKDGPVVAIVGISGAVGQEFLQARP